MHIKHFLQLCAYTCIYVWFIFFNNYKGFWSFPAIWQDRDVYLQKELHEDQLTLSVWLRTRLSNGINGWPIARGSVLYSGKWNSGLTCPIGKVKFLFKITSLSNHDYKQILS